MCIVAYSNLLGCFWEVDRTREPGGNLHWHINVHTERNMRSGSDPGPWLYRKCSVSYMTLFCNVSMLEF